jgi:diguanylate cyclase (GGDEF)-like protein
VDGSPAGQTAPSQQRSAQLAKDWLVRMIERTPLPEVGELPVSWLAVEAPPLIDAILGAVSDPSPASELAAAEGSRAARLAGLRTGPRAAEQILRDLGALQALLVGALSGERAGHEVEFAGAVERMAEIFASIQAAVASELAGERLLVSSADPVTGLPGPAQLEERLAILFAEQRRYGHPFSLALVDIDGLGRINDAYGRDGGDRMLSAVAAILRRQVRDVDRAFRLEEDEFAIVAPHTDAERLVPMTTRIAGVIAGSQSPDGPRIAIAAGVVTCPDDGLSAERLLESATEAIYAAKASGAAVARSPRGSDAVLQDP